MCGKSWGWGSIIIGKNIEQLSGMQSMSFVMFPRGFMTESEAGSCRPSHWTTHLVPADAFTALRLGWPSGCTAEHQNINTAQTQPGPWDYLQGKQDRLLSLWKTETHSRQGGQCVNRAKRCSVAPNGSLIHSRIVIWKSYTWDDYLQFWLF